MVNKLFHIQGICISRASTFIYFLKLVTVFSRGTEKWSWFLYCLTSGQERMAGSSSVSYRHRELCCFSSLSLMLVILQPKLEDKPLWSGDMISPGLHSCLICHGHRFSDGRCSPFLFLLKDQLFYHFAGRWVCSSIWNLGGHIWPCNTDKNQEKAYN